MIVAALGSNILDLEPTHMSTCKKMVKPTVGYLHTGLLDDTENSGTIVITLKSTEESYVCSIDQKEANIVAPGWLRG